MTEIMNDDYIAAQMRMQAAREQQEFNLLVMLKPKIERDGNQWCVLYGEDLHSGIAGFGNSIHAAIINFNAKWYKTI